MWNFLRSGQSGVQAASTLEDLLHDLDRLEGDISSDQVVAANAYLIWVEKAERQLLSIFRSFAIPRALQSERYWKIRAMDFATSRPMPLIYAEIRMQRMSLQDLSAQLKHYLSMLAQSTDHWIIVPDTNVYVHGELFHEVEWHREIGVRGATIVMPLVVLDELDKIKDRDLEFGKRARSVLRALDILSPRIGSGLLRCSYGRTYGSS